MNKKVLIVEDVEEFSTFLKTVLEDNGYTVMTASNGNEGEDMLAREKPDLVTLDLMMPEKSGIKLYRELRTKPEWKDIPVIIITGVTQDTHNMIDFRTFFKGRSIAEPDGYLEKPIGADEIIKTVQKVLTEKC
ncbi:MAG: response regulator [bacterium]